MEKNKFSFEDLKVYQKSLEFINLTYDTTSRFPKEENYRLNSQFIRAAHSIALNIAEGAGDSNPQFIRFLKISLGSVKECIVCITIAKNQTFITEKEYQKMRKELTEISKMINSLIKYLRTSTND